MKKQFRRKTFGGETTVASETLIDTEGSFDGSTVGLCEGSSLEGPAVGVVDGLALGASDGGIEGETDGELEGSSVVGPNVGLTLGSVNVGLDEGDVVGVSVVGNSVGAGVGEEVTKQNPTVLSS